VPWDPDEWEEDILYPVRVFWDEGRQDWACRCLLYEKYGRCAHLTRYRRQAEVRVLEEYL